MKPMNLIGVAAAIVATMAIGTELLRGAGTPEAPSFTKSRLPAIQTCEMVPVTQTMTWACRQLYIQRHCGDNAACLIGMGASI